MEFRIAFSETYPHPVEKVWQALIDPEAIGKWLMETDFVPEAGRDFQMWCDDGHGGTDHYLCKVLALEPPHRMVWSWLLDGRQDEGETFVEFRLEGVDDGTRLTVEHSGDRPSEIVEAFRSGWPYKLEELERTLRSDNADR